MSIMSSKECEQYLKKHDKKIYNLRTLIKSLPTFEERVHVRRTQMKTLEDQRVLYLKELWRLQDEEFEAELLMDESA